MSQIDLFEEGGDKVPEEAIIASYMMNEFDSSPDLSGLFELSVNAYYAALHAMMSGLPVKGEIRRFIEKTRRASDRAEAERIASDRGDDDVLAVLKAAHKVQVEIHRLTGILRFTPDPAGVYIARCSPDYFILPALAEHFALRFGATSWAIIDEKRGLCLQGGIASDQSSANDAPALQITLSPSDLPPKPTGSEADPWEGLWRLYHRSVNNEARNNRRLQRQFMPERYHKYLPEIN